MAIEEVVILGMGIQHKHILSVNIDAIGNIRQVVEADIHRVITPIFLDIEHRNLICDEVVFNNLYPARRC